MKNFFVGLWLFGVACLSIGIASVQTDTFLFPIPHELDKLTSGMGQGERSNVPRFSQWHEQHRQCQVKNIAPIKDGGKLLGWKIEYVKSYSPTMIGGGYLPVSQPFVMSIGTNADTIMKEMWMPVRNRFNAVYKTWPVVLNVYDGKVFGLWYLYEDKYSSIGSKGRYSKRIPAGREGEIFTAMSTFQEAKQEAVAAIPTTALGEASRNRAHLETDPDVLAMAPFKVSVSQWIDIGPMVDKKGSILKLIVTGVIPNTPPARAGLKVGASIVSIQGIRIIGLSQASFKDFMAKTPMGSEIRIEVVNGSGTRTIVIPVTTAATVAAN